MNDPCMSCGEERRTAILQNLVSLPAPMLTIWHCRPSCPASSSHSLTSLSIASERTYVPTLMSGGRGGCRWAPRGTRDLMNGSEK